MCPFPVQQIQLLRIRIQFAYPRRKEIPARLVFLFCRSQRLLNPQKKLAYEVFRSHIESIRYVLSSSGACCQQGKRELRENRRLYPQLSLPIGLMILQCIIPQGNLSHCVCVLPGPHGKAGFIVLKGKSQETCQMIIA